MRAKIQTTTGSTPYFIVETDTVPRIGERVNFPFVVNGGSGGLVDSVEWGFEGIQVPGVQDFGIQEDGYGALIRLVPTVYVLIEV